MGKGPVIFTPENADRYGTFLGKRYKDFPNIIWINGGDRSGGTDAAGTGDNFRFGMLSGKVLRQLIPTT